MKPIVTEAIIPLGEDAKSIFSPMRIKISVDDEGAGPWLRIEGIDEDKCPAEHCFYLQSEAEIDEFSAICKRILKEAEEAST